MGSPAFHPRRPAVLTQPNGDFWNAMRTGMGTRLEPLLIAATTAGNDPTTFAKSEHECVKIVDDLARAPHRFVYLRNLPEDADPWDEATGTSPTPRSATSFPLPDCGKEALEARNDPARENAFRQYRLNQWVSQSSRWMPMHLYTACTGTSDTPPTRLLELHAGRPVWGGLDLASKMDMTTWCLIVPNGIDGHPPRRGSVHAARSCCLS